MVATDETGSMGRTSIQVSDELADELYNRKNRGESYEDVIWRLIEDKDEADDIATSGVSEPEPEPERTPVETVEPDESDLDDVERALEDVEFPSTKSREECVGAVRAAYEYLQDNGSATMREFVREVMPDHPVGYDVPDLEPGERYRGAWWRKVVKPGLNVLPGVESPPKGGSDWTYTGDADE